MYFFCISIAFVRIATVSFAYFILNIVADIYFAYFKFVLSSWVVLWFNYWLLSCISVVYYLYDCFSFVFLYFRACLLACFALFNLPHFSAHLSLLARQKMCKKNMQENVKENTQEDVQEIIQENMYFLQKMSNSIYQNICKTCKICNKGYTCNMCIVRGRYCSGCYNVCFSF